MAETDRNAISDYQKTKCQLQNVVFDTGGIFRPFLITRIKQIVRKIPFLARAKRMLKEKIFPTQQPSQEQNAPDLQKSLSVSTLGLRSGEWVRVRSANDIKATLDANSCHGRTRFLEGMWKFCGKKVRVFKRIEEIVDYRTGRMWKVRNTVVLTGVHCEKDPSEYYRCDQTCFYYWKEIWLERCEAESDSPKSQQSQAHS